MNAAIFDFDGLIVDTEWPEVQAWQELFISYGTELPDTWVEQTIGRGADQEAPNPVDSLFRMLGREVTPDQKKSIEGERLNRRLELIAEQPALPGVVDRLEEAKRLGWGLAVASSSGRDWVVSGLTRLGLTGYFQAVLTRNDVAQTKPAPDLYLAAVQALGSHPSKAVALEDSPAGIAAAKAAGLYVVAVPNRITGRLDLSQADVMVDSLKNICFETLVPNVK